jgi:hypothetical protein
MNNKIKEEIADIQNRMNELEKQLERYDPITISSWILYTECVNDIIQSLKNRLNELEKQLNNQEPITINNANVGDVIDGGWIVGHKEERAAILISPMIYEKYLKWVDIEQATDGYPDLFIPSKEIFALVFNNIAKTRNNKAFNPLKSYWTSDKEYRYFITDNNCAVVMNYYSNDLCYIGGSLMTRVRPFKLVAF